MRKMHCTLIGGEIPLTKKNNIDGVKFANLFKKENDLNFGSEFFRTFIDHLEDRIRIFSSDYNFDFTIDFSDSPFSCGLYEISFKADRLSNLKEDEYAFLCKFLKFLFKKINESGYGFYTNQINKELTDLLVKHAGFKVVKTYVNPNSGNTNYLLILK